MNYTSLFAIRNALEAHVITLRKQVEAVRLRHQHGDILNRLAERDLVEAEKALADVLQDLEGSE